MQPPLHKVDDLLIVCIENSVGSYLSSDLVHQNRSETEKLDGDKGSHCNHSNDTECIGKNASRTAVDRNASTKALRGPLFL